MRRVAAEDVAVGDVLVFGRAPYQVVRIQPYDHPSIGRTFGMAHCEPGDLTVALFSGVTLEVAS